MVLSLLFSFPNKLSQLLCVYICARFHTTLDSTRFNEVKRIMSEMTNRMGQERLDMMLLKNKTLRAFDFRAKLLNFDDIFNGLIFTITYLWYVYIGPV
jgi:hypothetical protein